MKHNNGEQRGVFEARKVVRVFDRVGSYAQIFFIKFFFYICTMAKKTNHQLYVAHNVSRPGVHAKTKHSNHKSSKNYTKKYRGQGR